MGNSADRAWHLSQLVERVLLLSTPATSACLESKQTPYLSLPRKRKSSTTPFVFSFPHEVGYFVGTPFIARRCVSKQIGRHDAACQDCPRGVSRSPEAHCFWVVARTVRFPNLRCCPRCWLFSCLGVYFHLRILPESTERSAAAIFRSQRSFITFYGALRIFCCRQDFLPCSI